jgi:hypothetical protein
MASDAAGPKGWLRRCADATNAREAWLALGVVFLVLGLMSRSTAYFAIGAVFLAVGFARLRPAE